MFDRISPRYDLLNRVLSLGIDQRWRRRLVGTANKTDAVLDLATGTGDQLLEFMRRREVQHCVGLDLSSGMLEYAAQKLNETPATLVRASADSLPFADNSFDVVSISFGIRNVVRLDDALREMHRVLKPGGECLILEFGLPKAALVRMGYLFYFRHVLPIIGGMISGDSKAYRYLNSSVEKFPYDQAFADRMLGAGFSTVTFDRLSLGIAYLYRGVAA
jgi:demethylmenaquinone methyltransferase/2-methoxy-6-polyprenyl-1,4-benzoquinol methylase